MLRDLYGVRKSMLCRKKVGDHIALLLKVTKHKEAYVYLFSFLLFFLLKDDYP